MTAQQTLYPLSLLLTSPFKDIFILFNQYECFACVHACMCTPCMPDAQEGQKTVSDPLEVELQMVVSQRVGVGNQTLVFPKTDKCFYH